MCVDCRQFVGEILEYCVMVVGHDGATFATGREHVGATTGGEHVGATTGGEHVGVIVTTGGA